MATVGGLSELVELLASSCDRMLVSQVRRIKETVMDEAACYLRGLLKAQTAASVSPGTQPTQAPGRS